MYTVAYNRPRHMACQPTTQNRTPQPVTEKRTTPLANIFSKNDGWDIVLSVPGYTKEEIQLTIDNQVLKVTGRRIEDQSKMNRKEWSNIEVSRAFTLPENANLDGIQAEMKNGLLTLFVPKMEVKVSNISVK